MACNCLTGGKLLRCYRVGTMTKAAGGDERPSLDAVQRNMVRMRRVLMIDGSRRVTELFGRVMEGHVEKVISEAQRRFSLKATREVHLPGNEILWLAVLNDILGPEAAVELVSEYKPIAQSVIAKAYDKTCIFLGEEQAPDASAETLRRAKTIGNRVKAINETTRARLQRVIAEAVAEGESPSGVAQAIRDALPEIVTKRLPTIARNEVGNLIDQGIKQAVTESNVVKTVRVVGCKAVEPGIPTYRGRPTCNITGVPARDADMLEFHINHTGAIVAESFYD